MKNTISFPSAPELVQRSLSQDSVTSSSSSSAGSDGIHTPTSDSQIFDDKFGGEPRLTAQQLALFIKYTLLSNPVVKKFEFSACVKVEFLGTVVDWKISIANQRQRIEQDLECTQKLVKYSKFQEGLPKYTITKSKTTTHDSSDKQADEPLRPLIRNFGSVCLHQFPERKFEPFIPDSDDEDEEMNSKDILYI
ncbi:hypothetical protein QFC24_004010 [Naganishia onofrii]|uniref:Uncharacterized protein n=1 Tax=Naganishia onofrii TaxID=1851511 RepID=A0ACC2XJR1_9TREE|nr:hypothetical protein QFC24_004010 [Naganishia onofrii]